MGQVKRCGVKGGDTRVKSIKCDRDEQKSSSFFQETINCGDTRELAETAMTKKVRQVFQEKNIRVPPRVLPSLVTPLKSHPLPVVAVLHSFIRMF